MRLHNFVLQLVPMHELDCSVSFTLLKKKTMRNTSTPGMIGHVLERALIFLRLRLSLRDRFFFHFSLILQDN